MASAAAAGAVDRDRPAVLTDGLHVRRGSTTALEGVDLRVAPGRVTGLLGPSGSGKTTLLRAVLGVQLVQRGTVHVLGEPAGSRGLRRRVGYVSQSPSVYEDLTVAENLRYFARILGVGRGRVDAVLGDVDLTGRRDQLVRTLSGGELSRVSLGAALLGRPELLVLDEPTVGLDPVLRESLWTMFRGLASGGTTLLVSSHVMDEATRCDELVLLRAGRVLAQDTPAGLLDRTGRTTAEGAFLALVQGEGAP